MTNEEYRFWNEEYGRIYHHLEGSTPYKKLVSRMFDLSAPHDGKIILDAGVGSGLLVQKILENSHPGRIYAIDVSEIQLKYLKNRLTSAKHDIKVEQHDLGNKTNYSNGHFDLVISNLVLSYISDFEGRKGEEALVEVLKEMHRILKNGGYLCWSTPVKNVNFTKVFLASALDMLNPRHLSRLVYGPIILKHALQIQKKGKSGMYNFFEQDKIKKIMESVGFSDIKIERAFAGQAFIVKAKKWTTE